MQAWAKARTLKLMPCLSGLRQTSKRIEEDEAMQLLWTTAFVFETAAAMLRWRCLP
jgi:hypothetical protein